jgi:hypothetical protein
MRISNTMLAIIFLGLLTSGTPTSAQAAPLPTNITTMKSMLSSDVVQARWGGWRGGWGYRGWGYRSWGYRGWRLGAAAAGAIVGGAIASSAYYDGYPYYGGAYACDYCSPYYGYGGYCQVYYAYPYRRYYSSW